MIPKKIHYIWFGGKPKPLLILNTIESWTQVLPDYEIVEWNEHNFDITIHPWMEKMYRLGKFAFASDWARLYVLQQHGGIYLDTDVEIIKPLDPFLRKSMFWGFEYDCYLATCITGSRAGHPLLAQLLAEYDHVDESVINNTIVTRFFLKRFPEFRLNNANQILADDIHIFGKEYFSVPSFDRFKNFSRHHGSNLWNHKKREADSWLKSTLRYLLGEVMYFKIISYRVCMKNEFRTTYKEHCKRK